MIYTSLTSYYCLRVLIYDQVKSIFWECTSLQGRKGSSILSLPSIAIGPNMRVWDWGDPHATQSRKAFFFFLHILHLVGYPHTPSGLKKNNINSTVNTSLIRMTLGLVEAYLTESGPHKGRYILHAYVGFSLFCHLRNHFSPGMKANDTHQSTTYHTQHADVNSV